MKKLLLIAFSLVVVLILQSCAILKNGSSQEVTVGGSSPHFAIKDKIQRFHRCVSYRTMIIGGRVWSEYYLVYVDVMEGSVLNEMKETYKYESSSTYVVIDWSQEEANIPIVSQEQVSVIKLTNFVPRFRLNANGTGIDQRGKRWLITKPPCL